MAVQTVGASANQIQTDFMRLLVTQLQNQDPLEPMNNNEMANQLAQLSSLEQLEHMNGTFSQVLAGQERLQAMGLIGKEVDFLPNGEETVLTGRVTSVKVTDEGVRLVVGEKEASLDDVQAIRG